jgi:hypothetical protein
LVDSEVSHQWTRPQAHDIARMTRKHLTAIRGEDRAQDILAANTMQFPPRLEAPQANRPSAQPRRGFVLAQTPIIA